MARLLDSKKRKDDDVEISLRPQFLNEYIGQ